MPGYIDYDYISNTSISQTMSNIGNVGQNAYNAAIDYMVNLGINSADPIDHGKIALPYRIGFPPDDLLMKGRGQGPNAVPEDTNQFLIRMDLSPRLQTLDFGSHVFYTKPALSEYKKTLLSHGVGLLSNALHLYILSEGAISDGASSSYGPSFLGSTFNIFSSIMPRELISLARANPAVQDFAQKLGARVKAGKK